MKIVKNITKNMNQRVFQKWLLYHLTVIIFTLAISFIVFLVSSSILEKEITKAHSASLKQLKQFIDSDIEKIEKTYLQVNINQQIKEIMMYEYENLSAHILTMKDIQKDLRYNKFMNKYIYDCYLYFKNSDFILSDSGKYAPEIFHEFIHNYNISYDQWNNEINSRHTGYYLPSKMSINSNKKDVLLYIRSLSSTSNSLTNFVAAIDKQLLINAIEDTKWIEESNILIMNENNQIIINPSNITLPMDYTYEYLENASLVLFNTFNKEKVVISQVNSDVNDWKYISIIPKSVFFKEGQKSLNIAIFTLLILFILDGYITYYITKKNYSPVKRIIQYLDTHTDKNSSNQYEFALIENTLQRIINENKQISSDFKKQSLILKRNFLVRILKGNLYGISVEDSISHYSLDLFQKDFTVLLINIEDFSEMFYDKTLKENDANVEISTLIVENVFEEILKEKFSVEGTRVDNFIAFIINISEKEVSTLKQELSSIFNYAKEFIETNFNIVFTAYVSEYNTGYDSIKELYDQTLIAYEYGNLIGSDGIQFYSNINKEKNFNDELSVLDDEKLFINYLTSKSFDKGKEHLNKIIENWFHKDNISLEVQKCRRYVLINMVIGTIKKLSETDNNKLVDKISPDAKLFNCNNINELHIQINEIIDYLEDYYKDYNTQNNIQEISQKALDIINKHLTDPNLSVSMIADILGVSVSYVSTFFKKNIGVSTLDYIHNLRLEKAKDFLIMGNMNIKDIALTIGYNNSLTLIRVFKKYEGTTPGKFRQTKKQ